MRFVIITGMSGAGKSQAVKVFEDMNYYVVDNLPPSLLIKFVDVISSTEGKFSDVALVMDIRSGKFFEGIEESMDELHAKNIEFEILFLDASDEEIVTRFKETRRVHPLSSRERLLNGIQKERKILSPIRKRADTIIDTTGLTLRKFQETIKKKFRNDEKSENAITVNVVSFGFKYGVPVDCDMIFDVRFIENPFYIDELRPLSGTDMPVRDFVLENPVTREFLKKETDMMEFLIPHYIDEGKRQLIIGIGCTGGRHRSVAITEETARLLRERGYHATAYHRDRDEDVREARLKV